MLTEILSRPRIQLCNTPTRLEENLKLSALVGRDLLIKRDDTLDEWGCGHKLRSLEYLIPHYRDAGATCFVTYGSQRSNHTKAVAMAGMRVDRPVHVLFGGDTFSVPERLQGSCLMTALSGAQIYWCDGISWHAMQSKAEKFCESLKTKGERPALVSPQHGLFPGLLGFFALAEELNLQLESRSNVNLIVPVGTGSLAAGVGLASSLASFNWKIHGICMTTLSGIARGSIEQILASCNEHIPELRNNRHPPDIRLYDDLAFQDYDRFDQATLAIMKALFVKTGIMFEANYMLKCLLATKELIMRGSISDDETVVLVHTGGHFSLLDLPKPMTPSNEIISSQSI